MSSLVSEFLINPVLRQARRFSEISRTTFAGEDEVPPAVRPDSDAVGDSSVQVDASSQDPVTLPESPRHRPLSSSTQETIVEEAIETPIEYSNTPSRDHLGFPISPPRNHGPIPEDDGMRNLRARMHAINACDISSSEKAKLMHEAILAGYHASLVAASHGKIPSEIDVSLGQTSEHTLPSGPLDSLKFWHNQLGEHSGPETFVLSERDVAPTFAPIRPPKNSGNGSASNGTTASPDATQAPLGCQHYERNVKLQCSTCQKWYSCRFCHDAEEDHVLIRKDTKNMLCMLCRTPQRASDICVNCGEMTAQYYCNICKLWENRQSKPIYHCNDCGICRRGLGLGKDFFHCKTCRACITTSIETSHKCIERSTDCNCPICGDYMFTSPKPVVFMPCGHSIHKKCYDQHMKVSYRCPICNKSLANMETQFRNLDVAILGQPMPPEFRDTKANILCNDCSAKSTVPYHWLGLKCSICRSYNTVELQLLGGNSQTLQPNLVEQPLILVDSQAGPQLNLEPEPPLLAGRPTPVSSDPRVALSISNRRRHSSNGVDLQHRIPDRIARSASPPSTTHEAWHALITASGLDVEDEDGMLGFWGGGEDDDDSSDLGEEYDSDQGSSDDELDAEDEEDDANEITLIGHR